MSNLVLLNSFYSAIVSKSPNGSFVKSPDYLKKSEVLLFGKILLFVFYKENLYFTFF